jgi:hypothetical protein
VTAPPDLGQIAARLMTLSRDLDKQTEAAETLDYEAVTARHDYELAFARAFLSAEGAMDARKQKAILATDREHLDAEIKDARLRACKARIATLKVQIDTGRSLGAALRAEVSLAGSGWSA